MNVFFYRQLISFVSTVNVLLDKGHFEQLRLKGDFSDFSQMFIMHFEEFAIL